MSQIVAVLVALCIGLAVGSVFVFLPARGGSPGSGGTVEGVVSVGPAQPVCGAGMSCNVNMSGYSLIFTPDCSGLCSPLSRVAPLQADGSYSIALAAGKYTVSMDSCSWMGCSSALPRTVSVTAGEITLLNITIDMGIR
ncbi:MAG: hypothetical protein JRM99_03740 [Nitrososphaerota archaeon]|nr:hypothetical protein [Nitrososphaerota archaeon]